MAQDVSMFDTVYDYESITHYARNAFSNNGQATIDSKEPGGNILMVNTKYFLMSVIHDINAIAGTTNSS